MWGRRKKSWAQYWEVKKCLHYKYFLSLKPSCKFSFIFRQEDQQVELQGIKDILTGVDEMDRFQIRAQLHRLRVFDIARDELYQMRLLLKKGLLEEILKIEVGNRDVYSDKLKEINSLLQYKAKGYSCCLVGCRFVGDRHRQYVKHIKTTHPRATNVTCNFKNACIRNFSIVENLLSLIKFITLLKNFKLIKIYIYTDKTNPISERLIH